MSWDLAHSIAQALQIVAQSCESILHTCSHVNIHWAPIEQISEQSLNPSFGKDVEKLGLGLELAIKGYLYNSIDGD